jgi:NAD(P)H dehydrogenase (quinone)
MKMSVLYYSKSGNTEKMAQIIAAGMETVEGVEAKAFSLEEADEAWVRESRCVAVGTPTYMADLSGQVKVWMEGPFRKYELAGKLGGAFATADYIHGGAELAIRTILDHMMVFGMLAYSGGGSAGKPVIHLGPVAISGHLDESRETFELYGKRMAEKAKELWGGC